VIGLPGNPVSALVVAQLFITPLMRWMQGGDKGYPYASLKAKLEINIPSQAGREEWIPVRLAESDHGLTAQPIFFKSNLIFQLSAADGLIRIPTDANGLSAGIDVDVIFF